MRLRRISVVSVSALGLMVGFNLSAHAATTPTVKQIVIYQAEGKAYDSTLTVNLPKGVSSATANNIKKSLEEAMSTAKPTVTSEPDASGPSGGAFLVCNQAHLFSDTDGTYSVQHACGGTTAPWGYLISTGLCATVTSTVSETGMIWTRNGTAQPKQSPHVEGCRYQFHGTYNPAHDFDEIKYSDDFLFEVEGDENADLHIDGSFYSAACDNPSVCP
jgi:hypothetical protein